MKIITASNGKQTVKMSKTEWTSIGKKAGWMKVAQENQSQVTDPKIQQLISVLEQNSDPRIKRVIDLYKNNDIKGALTEYLNIVNNIITSNKNQKIKTSGVAKNILPFLAALMSAGALFANTPDLDSSSKAQVQNAIQELKQEQNVSSQSQSQEGQVRNLVMDSGNTMDFINMDVPDNAFTYAPVKDSQGKEIKEDPSQTVKPFLNMNGVRYKPVISINGKQKDKYGVVFDTEGKLSFILNADYCASEKSAQKMAQWLNIDISKKKPSNLSQK